MRRRRALLIFPLLFLFIAIALLIYRSMRNGTRVVQTSFPVTALAFSPNGKLLALGHVNGNISVWNSSDWSLVRRMEGHRNPVRAVSFSPDSARLASGASDSVKIWDVVDGRTHAVIDCEPIDLLSLTFVKNGGFLVLEPADEPVRIWDLALNKENRRLEGCVGGNTAGTAISPDGQVLALATFSRSVPTLWDISTGKELGVFDGNGSDASFLCVSFSPDGERIATGTWQGRTLVWDVKTRKEVLVIDRARYPITSVAFSPVNHILAVAESAKGQWFTPAPRITLWDRDSGQELGSRTNSAAGFSAVAFSPDGRSLVGASRDGSLLIWQLK